MLDLICYSNTLANLLGVSFFSFSTMTIGQLITVNSYIITVFFCVYLRFSGI